MHLHNEVSRDKSFISLNNGNYDNATFRARKGYREQHVHDRPYRRNRDFKPIPYGSYTGFLNFRHSEPFAVLKNI